MVRVRIAGPRSLLDRTLTVLQDLGVLHVDRPPVLEGDTRDRAIARPRRHVERSLADVETALTRLQVPDDTHVHGEIPASAPEAACRARRVRRRADALTVRRASFEGERALLLRYREFFQVFEALTGYELTWPDGRAKRCHARRDWLTPWNNEWRPVLSPISPKSDEHYRNASVRSICGSST